MLSPHPWYHQHRGVDREQKRRPAGRKILGHTPRTEGVKVRQLPIDLGDGEGFEGWFAG